MRRDTLTGSRIRDRRGMAGITQADLARAVGISPSYLNLIEHNRRRIGGKLLLDIAAQLRVEPSLLASGPEAALVAALREIAADQDRGPARGAAAGPPPELARVDEFAARFPGWAALLAQTGRRVTRLGGIVETLSDRLAHDPNLAASLHELLSSVTAIRSTAAILADTRELEPEWRDRFHRNLDEDSRRLADGSRALVAYLDSSAGARAGRGTEAATPQDEVEIALDAAGPHFPDLEGAAADPDAVLARIEAGRPLSGAARSLLAAHLAQLHRDAARLPLEAMRAAIGRAGTDPLALAGALDAALPVVMRRLAALPPGMLPHPVGLAVCDASGTLVMRRPLPGFALPRYGAACPLWPLFRAFGQPMTPLREVLAQAGQGGGTVTASAVAMPEGPADWGRAPLLRSYMLLEPAAPPGADVAPARPVGISCRICPQQDCAARREPSILSDGF